MLAQKRVSKEEAASSTAIAIPPASTGSASATAAGRAQHHHHHKSNTIHSNEYNQTVASQQNKITRYGTGAVSEIKSSAKPFLAQCHPSYQTPTSGMNRTAGNGNHNNNNNIKIAKYKDQPESSRMSNKSTADSVGGGKGRSAGLDDHQQQQQQRRSPINNSISDCAKTSIITSDKNNNNPPAVSTTVTATASISPPSGKARRSPPIAEHPKKQDPPDQDSSKNGPKNSATKQQPSKEHLPAVSGHSEEQQPTSSSHRSIPAPPPNHYPNELLKIIRDNMHTKDNTNLWALLNNIAAPLIIKNVNAANAFPPLPTKGSPTSSSAASGPGFDFSVSPADLGMKERALLQAIEQNFIQNNPGYELLANAILSNGGLLPGYFADPLMAPFTAPPAMGNAHGGQHAMNSGSGGGISTADSFNVKIPPPVESPGQGGGGSGFHRHQHQSNSNNNSNHHHQQQQAQHHTGGFQRMPPGGGAEPNHRGHQQQQQQQRHHSPAVYNSYANGGGACNNSNSNNVCEALAYNSHPFYYNGHLFYHHRPKNYWNFCLTCKKSEYCYQHTNNCNSSASHCPGASGVQQQPHHYIPVPNNFYAPDYYQRSYHHYGYYGGYNNNSNSNGNNTNGGGYYNHHHHNHHNQGHRDKRGHNGRRQFNKYQGNGNRTQQQVDSASTGSSTPSGSCPPSPKANSPSRVPGSATKGYNKGTQDHKRSCERKGPNSSNASNNGSSKPDQSLGNSSASSSSKSSLHQSGGGGGGGKKRWPQRSPAGGYESDTSSSARSQRAASAAATEAARYNYGLLQNMKLWHTDSGYKREQQLLAGELGPQQLMSPTNQRAFNAPPLLITVLETQGGGVAGGGDVCELTTTPPAIQQDEQDAESAYWSSVFPFAGGLDEGVDGVEEGTPADKYLANAHLVEMVETPKELIEGPTVAVSRDTLSQQVWNTFLTVQQTQGTYRKKLVIWKLLYACIKKVFPQLSVFLVGSTITGFGAETSDVDMCVVSSAEAELDPRLEAVINLTDLKKFLSVSGGDAAFEQFHLIQAKVPILRFRDTANHIEVDLNYNNSVGIRNTHLLYCYSKLDWRVRPLVLVVKLWAKYQDINNAKNMTISSYSLALMVIHFLQNGVSPCVLPCLHTMYPGKFQSNGDVTSIDMNEELDAFKSENKHTLGELLVRFLHYYSHFDYNNLAISVRTGTCLYIDECRYVRSPKNDPQQWKNLCIEEPFDFTNTARSVYDVDVFHKIKYVFSQSYQQLQQTLDLKSILNEKFISFPVHQYGYGIGQQQ